MNFKFNIKNKTRYFCYAVENGKEICKCIINAEDNRWVISSWYTNEKYKNRGIGKETMKNLLIFLYVRLGEPRSIEYIWNGLNEYVHKWIVENFDAYCKSPRAVQKYQSEDDWDSHIYILNKQKVLDFFDVHYESLY